MTLLGFSGVQNKLVWTPIYIQKTQCRLHVVRRPLFVIILVVILAIARLFCPVSATDERPVGMQLV